MEHCKGCLLGIDFQTKALKDRHHLFHVLDRNSCVLEGRGGRDPEQKGSIIGVADRGARNAILNHQEDEIHKDDKHVWA